MLGTDEGNVQEVSELFFFLHVAPNGASARFPWPALSLLKVCAGSGSHVRYINCCVSSHSKVLAEHLCCEAARTFLVL